MKDSRRKIERKLLILSSCAALLGILGLIAPQLVPFDPYQTDLTNALAVPGDGHLLGTDQLGRDEFSRILAGLRPSLFAALTVVLVSFVLGTLLGTVSGFFSGTIDRLVMWLITTFQVFPGFLLAVVIAGFLGGGLVNACLSMILIYWTTFARLARGLVASMKEETFIKASILNGCGMRKLFFKHIAPNILPVLIVTGSAEIGSVIVSMAGLSFLGLSSSRPTAEWGIMLSEAQELIRSAPQLALYAGGALIIVVLVFNLLGDTLRDYLAIKEN